MTITRSSGISLREERKEKEREGKNHGKAAAKNNPTD
jgi:hypothetical protein